MYEKFNIKLPTIKPPNQTVIETIFLIFLKLSVLNYYKNNYLIFLFEYSYFSCKNLNKFDFND